MINPSQKFDSLFAKYETKTRQIQSRLLRNKDLVDDAQQILWTRIWQTLQAGEPIRDAKSYLESAAYNEALRLRRDRADNRTLPLDELVEAGAEPAEDPEDEPVVSQALKSALRVALDRLPAKTAEVMNRFYYAGEPVVTIALAMNMPVSTVTSHLTRGRTALRSMFTRSSNDKAA